MGQKKRDEKAEEVRGANIPILNIFFVHYTTIFYNGILWNTPRNRRCTFFVRNRSISYLSYGVNAKHKHSRIPSPPKYISTTQKFQKIFLSLFFCCCCLWYLLLNQYIAPYISKNEIYVCMKMALANAFVYDRAPKRSDTELKINPNNSVLPLQKHRERERERDSERKIFVWMRVMWMNSGSEIEDLK